MFVFQTTNHSLKQMQAMFLNSIIETLLQQKLKAPQSTALPPWHSVAKLRAPQKTKKSWQDRNRREKASIRNQTDS